MAIMSSIEARSWRGRLLYAAIILVLCLGSISILYPFLTMLSGSVRSDLDQVDMGLIPRYWVDSDMLYRKFLETKYNQDVSALGQAYNDTFFSFRDVPIPQAGPAADEQIALFRRFLQQANFPRHWRILGGAFGTMTVPEGLRELRKRLRHQFNGDIEALNFAVGALIPSWTTIVIAVPEWSSRRFDYADNPIQQTYFQMLDEADPSNVQYVSLTGLFLNSMIYPVYGRVNTNAYNAQHHQPLKKWSDFRLPATVPSSADQQLRNEWTEFVRKEVNPNFVVFTGDKTAFVAFLQETYQHHLPKLNDAWHSDYSSFDQIVLPDGQHWLSGQHRLDYQEFLDAQPIEQLRLTGPEYAWRDWQVSQNLTPQPIPAAAMEYEYVLNHTGALRWTYTIRNYLNVLDQMLFEGRAMINTLVFCILAIVVSLLINPLAAYAMSRYKLPGTYKILLILMATMAFPPMVGMIPQFIILRKLDLLNTFAALVLPLAANGYLIFLLKGFFDSLPGELYEAAMIDGAGEIRMFFQIAMSLSKPILAVLALGTFNAAYSAFLYPLLVAPNPKMWLISVWLYQFQMNNSSGGVFASVVITSMPTLLIFLVTQRTIMRGIVVPTEK